MDGRTDPLTEMGRRILKNGVGAWVLRNLPQMIFFNLLSYTLGEPSSDEGGWSWRLSLQLVSLDVFPSEIRWRLVFDFAPLFRSKRT